jgi:uncharacterized protein (TIGR03089 family)
VTASTFPALLDAQLRRDGSRPLVTFYDDGTGERVELSVVTYANWVAKTAGLLQDELGVERGGTLVVALPTHWLGPVWLGAAWSVGLTVTADRDAVGGADVVVCGPDTVAELATAGPPVVALSLLPMATRFRTPLPDGVLDYGAAVWGQPDAFLPLDPPSAGDPAWAGDGPPLTQGALLAEAAGDRLAAPGTRLLTDLDPCSRAGLLALVAPLHAGGGTVWVRNADPAGWERRTAQEQATEVVRAGHRPRPDGHPSRS